MKRKLFEVLLIVCVVSVFINASGYAQDIKQHFKKIVAGEDEDRFMAKLQEIEYYSSPPVVEGQLELGRTWYDYATNQQMGRMMAHAFGSGDDGLHFAFMKIIPQGAERYVTYDYYYSPLSLFFGNSSVTEIERTGWGRVLNGDNDEALIAHHGAIQGTFLWQDALEAGYAFNQLLNVPGAPAGPVFPGIAKMGNNFVFMCQLQNLNYTGGDTVLVSTDNMQTWTGHNIIPWDPLATDLGAEFWPEFNPTNANEFSHVYSHNISSIAPNGETRLATSADLGATWNSIQILDDDELIGPDQIQYVAENFGQYCGMYSQDGNYHVVMGAVQGISDPVSGLIDIFPILYWNRNDDVFIELTDLEHGRPANPVVQAALLTFRPGNGLGNAYPQLAEGPDPGELICIWQQWEDDGMGGIVTQIVPPGVEIFMTDIWGAYSNNGGQSWSEPFFVAGTSNQSDVYPNITRNFVWNAAHDSILIDIAYMYDTNAGVSIPAFFNETSPSECIWYYERRSVSLVQEPNIAVSADTLDFGNAFVGFPDSLTLVVSNIGTELLTISDITSTNPDFTVGITAFSLNPGENQEVPVVFTPPAPGPGSGTLTITSNDPDEPTYMVFLQGEGILPPEIAVTPDSLSDSLFTGETSTHTLTIDNFGGGELTWEITIMPATSNRNFTFKPEKPLTWRDRWQAAQNRSRPLKSFGDKTLAINPQLPVVIDDPAGDAVTVDVTLVRALSISGELQMEIEFATVVDPFNFAGVLSLDIDQDNTTGPPPSFGNPNQDIGTEFEFIFFNLGSGFVDLVDVINGTLINSYPVTVQPNSISFSAPLADIGNDDGQMDVTGVLGDSFGPTDWFPDAGHGTIGGENWLAADPASGSIPAGSSQDVTVTFDAAGLFGGDYNAHIIVSSNDPATPEVTVPAHLHVTGIPIIAVSADTLDFGTAFVGFPDSLTLIVSNVGTAFFTVSDIISNNPDYTVGITAFTLDPGEDQEVPVIFAPSAVGTSTGTMTIVINDPNEPTYPVFLQGEGVIAPVIAVTPPSLSDSLNTGGTSTHTLTLNNTGGSDLVFNISIEEASALSSQRAFLPAAKSMKDKNNQPSATGPGSLLKGSSNNQLLLPSLQLNKGEIDTRIYPEMAFGSGGPDGFGYRWIDSNEPGGPVFDWIDASGGASIFLSDDDFITGIPLGFTFSYYGMDFTAIGVGSNGWLSFVDSDLWFPSDVPFLGDGFEGVIAPFASDLYPPTANYIRYQTLGSAPNRRFVVEFNNIPDYPGGINFKTFEVVLFEGSNKILYQYLIVLNDPVGFGIESPDETTGMGNAGLDSLFISPNLVEDNYAIEFILPPPWINVEPVSGIVPANNMLNLTVTFDAAGLTHGQYNANIIISSNDPLHPEFLVPAQLVVDSIVSINNPAEGEIPERYVLIQNYPNPFNPATTIRFGLPKPSQVKIEVFNLLGERVAVLLDERKPAGYHVITFDAAREGALASGMYFYRIQAGEFTDQKKMILIK